MRSEGQEHVSGDNSPFMESPLDKQREDPLGLHTKGYLTEGQQRARHEMLVEAPALRRERDGIAWTVTFTILPSFMLLLVMFFWYQVMPGFARPYRTILMVLMPNTWFSQPGTDDNPQPAVVASIVGVLLVAILVGLFLLRRRIGNAWADGTRGRFLLWIMQYPISLVIVAVIAVTPALIYTAARVARSSLFGGGLGVLPSWPLILTAITVLWWAIGTTRRAGRRAYRYRYRDWVQGADGNLYPPEQFARSTPEQYRTGNAS